MWTARDCELVHRNGSHARCRCSRTGTFGVLMDASPREVGLWFRVPRKWEGQRAGMPNTPATTPVPTAARGRPRAAVCVHPRGHGPVRGRAAADHGRPAEPSQPQVQHAWDPCKRGGSPGGGRAPLPAGGPQDPKPGAGAGSGDLSPDELTRRRKAWGQISGPGVRAALVGAGVRGRMWGELLWFRAQRWAADGRGGAPEAREAGEALTRPALPSAAVHRGRHPPALLLPQHLRVAPGAGAAPLPHAGGASQRGPRRHALLPRPGLGRPCRAAG